MYRCTVVYHVKENLHFLISSFVLSVFHFMLGVFDILLVHIYIYTHLLFRIFLEWFEKVECL